MTKKTVGFYGGKFSPVHLGHVASIIKASTQVDELHVAVITDEDWEKQHLYKNSKIKFPTIKQRARWLKETFKDHSHIHIHTAWQPNTGDMDKDWLTGAQEIWNTIGKPINKVFSSEPSYQQFFDKCYPEAEHVLIDPERKNYKISSTDIRRDGALKHWDLLPPAVQKDMIVKIAVIGTESNGKSTLCHNLALMLNTVSVDEYGRTFMSEVGDKYTLPDDYHRIALQHWLNVDNARRIARKFLIVDTEAIVTQNFSIMYEGFEQNIIDAVAKIQEYDLYILLSPDVDWVDDGTRIFGDENVRLSADKQLRKLLEHYDKPYVEISGDFNERLEKSLKVINDKFLI